MKKLISFALVATFSLPLTTYADATDKNDVATESLPERINVMQEATTNIERFGGGSAYIPARGVSPKDYNGASLSEVSKFQAKHSTGLDSIKSVDRMQKNDHKITNQDKKHRERKEKEKEREQNHDKQKDRNDERTFREKLRDFFR